MDFICKDYNSVLASLSQLIGVSEEKISSALEYDWDNQYERENDEYIDFGEYVLHKAFPNILIPIERPTVHWFHGARAIEPESYYDNGILPLFDMFPKVKQIIDDIAVRLHISAKECHTHLQEENRLLIEMKLGDPEIHGGPYAMLMYEALITPGCYAANNYTKEPEIISQYAYMKYDKEADIILDEFRRISHPMIVEFTEPENATSYVSLNHLITTAIHYLYRKIHDKKPNLCANTCFSNRGKDIPACNIVGVYILD